MINDSFDLRTCSFANTDLNSTCWDGFFSHRFYFVEEIVLFVENVNPTHLLKNDHTILLNTSFAFIFENLFMFFSTSVFFCENFCI